MNETLPQKIQRHPTIAFFGGAGVSTESGIPDFRSETGLYAAKQRYGRRPEELLSHGFFMAHPDVFYAYYRENLVHPHAIPNAAHHALSRLEAAGKLTALVTQNIDSLHQSGGSKNVLELHGSIKRNYCVACKKKFSLEFIMAQTGVPRCDCGGVVRPDVVLYGEPLDSAVAQRAYDALHAASLIIVGGTSLSVYPAAGLLEGCKGEIVLINKTATAYDSRASLVLRGAIGEVLGEAVGDGL